MLNCRACLWRCIRALDSVHSSRPYLPRNATAVPLPLDGRRTLRTSVRDVRKVEARPKSLSKVELVERRRQDPWRSSTQAAGLKKREKQGLRDYPRAAKTTQDAVRGPLNLGKRDSSVSLADWNKRKRELQHLVDPLELATFVTKELRKGREKEMLQLVRMASHSMQCIVSWNHLIDHNLANGRVSHAFKIYNDMKKRAQFPDSYTYTILLRGLSINANDSGVLEKALSIYHSMSAENTRVEPTIIHTNAVLKVCARANNMDALWGVAAKIPDNGPASANQITYTTILNAIRQNLLVGAPVGEIDEETAKRRGRGIMDARRVWDEIIGKWRQADLIIGEELVCAMGRLLLIGARPQDWDDVLSLVEQTMDIKRLVPRLGTLERKEAGFPPLRGPHIPENYRIEDDHLSPEGTARGAEFLPVATGKKDNLFSNPLTYATPSNNTLSMVQEACQKIVAVNAADKYWDLLTDPNTYDVVPDLDNVHFRLRVLRQHRASAEATKLLQDAAKRRLQLRPGTFRIAMSACTRSSNNHNSLRHAGDIVDLMMKYLETADFKVVAKYAGLLKGSPTAKGEDFLNALARLDPIVRDIRVQLNYGTEDTDGVKGVKLPSTEREQEGLTALREVYGVIDKLLLSDLISEEQKRPIKAVRYTLSAFLQRVSFKLQHNQRKPKTSEADKTPSEASQDIVPEPKRKPRWLEGRNGMRNSNEEVRAA